MTELFQRKSNRVLMMLLISSLLALLAAGCSANREEDEAYLSKLTPTYPHPQGWAASHVELLSTKNTNERKAQTVACTKCHASQEKAHTLGETVSCGASCHTTPGSDPSDPHARPHRPITVSPNQCSTCHNKSAGHNFAHYPSLAGLCSVCHQAQPKHLTGADPKAVTTDRSSESCFRCHNRNDRQPHLHAALQMGQKCTNCHDAHGASHRSLVKAQAPQLCLNCHENTPYASGKSVHGIINDERSCLNCHQAHSADHGALLVTAQRPLCLSCHNQEIITSGPGSRQIPNIAQKVNEMPFVHSPAEEDCTSTCHNPHATNFDRLLTDAFPTSNYNRYSASPNTYSLCFNCHDDGMLKKSISAYDTGFRNDVLKNGVVERNNLHWFHVVDAAGSANKDLGRSCGICHDPHGTTQAHNVKTSWKMGLFEVEIKYTPSNSGGQCSRSCHDTRTYQRID
jgi:predicted CXXCH cytochrome family protein